MIVTLVEEETESVVTVKVAEVEPLGTVTLAGTVAADVGALESVTRIPPEGAAAVRLTVPVTGLPPTMLVGFTVTEASAGGAALMVSTAVLLTLA